MLKLAQAFYIGWLRVNKIFEIISLLYCINSHIVKLVSIVHLVTLHTFAIGIYRRLRCGGVATRAGRAARYRVGPARHSHAARLGLLQGGPALRVPPSGRAPLAAMLPERAAHCVRVAATPVALRTPSVRALVRVCQRECDCCCDCQRECEPEARVRLVALSRDPLPLALHATRAQGVRPASASRLARHPPSHQRAHTRAVQWGQRCVRRGRWRRTSRIRSVLVLLTLRLRSCLVIVFFLSPDNSPCCMLRAARAFVTARGLQATSSSSSARNRCASFWLCRTWSATGGGAASRAFGSRATLATCTRLRSTAHSFPSSMRALLELWRIL